MSRELKQFGALFNEKLKINNEKLLNVKIFNSSFFIFNSQMRAAITLAEVLITLTIISVVAAITLPTLIQHHRNTVVENKLKRFYSVMQQAIKMSEAENGELQYWYQNFGTGYTSADILEWYEKYLGKYIKSVKIEQNRSINNSNRPIVYLPDGSAFTFDNPSRDIRFLTQPGKCNTIGVCTFKFILYPYGLTSYGQAGHYNAKQFLQLCTTNSASYCTGYIHFNGWKIPVDYPFKVK